MHTCGIYKTITITHNFVLCRHLIELIFKNVTYHRTSNDNIIVFLISLFHDSFFKWTYQAIINFYERHLQFQCCDHLFFPG